MTEPNTSTHVRLTDQMVSWVAAAIEQYGAPDQVTWDAFPQMFPTPMGEGLVTVLGVYVQIPGSVVNTNVNSSMVVQPGATEEAVKEMVRQQLESARQGRSDQLSKMEQQQMTAARNGNETPTGGIIVPGQ